MREHSLFDEYQISIMEFQVRISKEYLTYRFRIRFWHRVYILQGLAQLTLELNVVELHSQVNDVGVVDWWR